jgi:hypothetical protein
MAKTALSLVCVLLMVALATLAFANGASEKGGTISKATTKFYKGSVAVVQETEGHLTGILRNTFGLFNPCLDLVKGCTSRVLFPLEATANYVAKVTTKPKPVIKKEIQDIPVPKKPDLPQ